MRHIMVDLETLGLDPDSVIVSVGAVVFTDKGIESEGYWTPHLDQPGRHVSLSTVKWWMQQDEAARAVFSVTPAYSLSHVLDEFAQEIDQDTLIWSNGANFDEVLLANAYRAAKKPVPWAYRNVRCFRTLRAQYPDVTIDSSGTKHNALDDARWQAQLLLEIVKQKGIELK